MGIASVDDAPAGIDAVDDIGAGADGDGQTRLLEVGDVGVGARQHRHERENQRQFAIVGAREIEADRVGVGRRHGLDQRESRALRRPAVIAQKLEREAHVVGGDRRAVGEMGAGLEAEGRVIARRVRLDGLCDQPIKRKRLVI